MVFTVATNVPPVDEIDGAFRCHQMIWFRSNVVDNAAGGTPIGINVRLEGLVRSFPAPGGGVRKGVDRRGTFVLVDRIIHPVLSEQLVGEIGSSLLNAGTYYDISKGMIDGMLRMKKSLQSATLQSVQREEYSKPIGGSLE